MYGGESGTVSNIYARKESSTTYTTKKWHVLTCCLKGNFEYPVQFMVQDVVRSIVESHTNAQETIWGGFR